MRARATLFGHPIHVMLVAFPLGLFAASVVFDLIWLLGGSPRWTEIASTLIGTGILGALLAAPFGLIDWLSIPEQTRAKQIGAVHGGGNLVVVVLMLGSWLLRRDAPTTPEAVAVILSFAAVALTVLTGWLGAELVNRHGMGVHEEAHLDAPSTGTAPGRP